MKWISFYSSILLSLLLSACTPEATPPTSTSQGTNTPKLGFLQAELRLPQGEECSRFTALDLETREEIFAVNVEPAQVRNNQYSFAQALEVGEYNLVGHLDCVSEEGEPKEEQGLLTAVVLCAWRRQQTTRRGHRPRRGFSAREEA